MKTFKWHAHFDLKAVVYKARGFTPEEHEFLKRICSAVRAVFGKESQPLTPFTVTELDTGFFSLSVETPSRRFIVMEPSLSELAKAVETHEIN